MTTLIISILGILVVILGFTTFNLLRKSEKLEDIILGDERIQLLFTPGHAPGEVSLYSATQNFVIAGDVLFQGSIGRTDLPGGNMDVLLESVRTQLFTLPDNTAVHSGHGPSTTIGNERLHNPFFK